MQDNENKSKISERKNHTQNLYGNASTRTCIYKIGFDSSFFLVSHYNLRRLYIIYDYVQSAPEVP